VPEFHIVMQSDCDNCEREEKGFEAFTGRSAKGFVKKTCWVMSGERKDKTKFAAPFDCTHHTYAELKCNLKSKNPPFCNQPTNVRLYI